MRPERSLAVPVSRASARRLVALIAAMLMSVALALVPPAGVAGAADYPGQAEIAVAKAAVADASSTVADIDAAIVKLAEAAHQADIAARLAVERYSEAQELSIEAQRQLFAANKRLDEADASLTVARGQLAGVAMASYRGGGDFGQFEALVSADGFDDMIVRSEALSRASVEAESTMQQVKAAELVAATMRVYAEIAADEATAAEQTASTALEQAQQARVDAEQALADEEDTREAALERLADLQRTSVELERERQEGLAAERLERERAAWLDVQESAAQQEAAEQEAAERDSSDGGGSGSTGDSSEPDEAAPAPAPAPSPAGTWRSTAAQGQAAVDHALTLLGSPYQTGGNGPSYDCSGLTKASWGAAGITIPRTSRTQYEAATLVPFSSLRNGDLIFWGTDRDPSKIYHVAIYIGDGKIVEASKPGVPVRIRAYDNWGVENLMPYAGRP